MPEKQQRPPDFSTFDNRDLLIRIATTVDFMRDEVGEMKDRVKALEKDRITSDSWRLVKQDIADLRRSDDGMGPVAHALKESMSDHEKRLRNIERFVYYFLGISTTVLTSIKIIEVISKLYQSAVKP